jgi:DNA-binding MarR family transcriptional regulator
VKWLTDKEMHAWLGYRRMRLLLELQLGRDLMAESGLSEPDYDVLSNLSSAPDHCKRLSELAAHMRWSKSRLSHHVTRMQQRGLVARDDCDTDARGSVIVLTPQGLSTLEQAAPGHVTSVRKHLFDLLTDEEIEVLGKLTHRVAARLEA